jgi:hypothetical protein
MFAFNLASWEHDHFMSETLPIAQTYQAAGLSVLPAIRAEKRPAIGKWKQYQQRIPTTVELSAWPWNDALCIICGKVSGNLEIIDFDGGGELFPAWMDRIPADLRDQLVIESTPSGGMHAIYRCDTPVCGNIKLAQRKVDDKVQTLIETRGEGGLFLCAPSPGYELLQGDLCNLPILTEAQRDTLLRTAWERNEYWPPVVNGPSTSSNNSDNAPLTSYHGQALPENSHRPGDDYNHRGDPREVLRQHGWVLAVPGENEYWRRPGKDTGWSGSLKHGVFHVFSTNAAPFEPRRPYSPFAVYTLLNHGGDFDAAARSLRDAGYGDDSLAVVDTGADISGILAQMGNTQPEDADNPLDADDPGPIPEHLFHVPGFVDRLMDFTLANAPYPNVGLAFCGAMALQSFLCGRKVCDPGDLRPNIYLLALASSGTGKDFPRKVNARVLFEINQVASLGDKFASGEGIQDALARTPAMLFQNDEMDGVLRSINLDKENKRESIPNILLTLYTSANDVYPLRVKAGQKEAAHIDQPHLTLFGTATPKYFYESLSQRMLTNGFFARLIIVDIGKRGEGQEPGSARNIPDPILEIARWWSEFLPGTRRANLLEVFPDPRIVPCSPDAKEAMRQFQLETESEYRQSDEHNDEVARVAWSRTLENAKKLALIYACSENHEDPMIGLQAVQWAQTFAMHQTKRQLFLASSYVAENPFHAECLKLTRKLSEAPNRQLSHQVLLKRMKMKAKEFKELIDTMLQGGEIISESVQTTGRPGLFYRLLPTVKEGEAW